MQIILEIGGTMKTSLLIAALLCSTQLFAFPFPEDDILLDFLDDIQTLLEAERENLSLETIQAIENFEQVINNYLENPNLRNRNRLRFTIAVYFLRALEIDGVTPREQLFLDLLETYFPRIYLPPMKDYPVDIVDTSWVDWSN